MGKFGGIFYIKADGKMNLAIAAPVDDQKNIKLGAETLETCGTQIADASACPELVNARFELSPMFNIEKNKRGINCSPYSHKNVEPVQCKTQLEAQSLCAQDKKCMAYNWVDSSYSGAEKDMVWLCWEIHDVHLKTENDQLEGWELGVRLGFSEDLIEEA